LGLATQPRADEPFGERADVEAQVRRPQVDRFLVCAASALAH
jgi:hypothetical protein